MELGSTRNGVEAGGSLVSAGLGEAYSMAGS